MRFREIMQESDRRPLDRRELAQLMHIAERVIATVSKKSTLNETDHPGNPKMLSKDQLATLKGMISLPDLSMNKSNGNFYQQMRFFLAMAGAPDYPTPPAGAMAGDPSIMPYSSADLEIIKSAIDMVGGGRMLDMTDNKSREREDTNIVSPVANWMHSDKPKKVEPKVLK